MGQWVEDPNEPSEWRYDRDAQPIPQEPAMTQLTPSPWTDPNQMPQGTGEPEVERIRPRSDLDATGEPIR